MELFLGFRGNVCECVMWKDFITIVIHQINIYGIYMSALQFFLIQWLNKFKKKSLILIILIYEFFPVLLTM